MNPDHLTILLTKKGKALMNSLEPGQKLKALAKLKAFVDAEHARANIEYESLLKNIAEEKPAEPKPNI